MSSLCEKGQSSIQVESSFRNGGAGMQWVSRVRALQQTTVQRPITRLSVVGTPRSKRLPHGLKEQLRLLSSHIHTEHRPHAAPEGQKETLIRGGRIHQNQKRYSQHGSGAAGAGRRPWQGRSGGLTSPPLAQALH